MSPNDADLGDADLDITPTPTDPADRLAALESRFATAYAFDARIKAIEGKVDKLGKSSLRDWLGTLGPYLGGVTVLVLGYWLKDSVQLAMAEKQFDLANVKEMRDLIKDLDKETDVTSAKADAEALALFGHYALVPLMSRLQGAGEIAAIGAEHGLEIVGQDREHACPVFQGVLADANRRHTWTAHQAIVRVIGHSGCRDALPGLQAMRTQLQFARREDKAAVAFAQRFRDRDAFDREAADLMLKDTEESIATLKSGGVP